MHRKLFPVFCCVFSFAAAQQTQRETVAKPISGKQAKKRDRDLRKELETYDTWIKQDVAYIITDDERKAFSRLSNNEERDQFIEQFWLRRDPTPDTEENEFKEEHYRRIAYANERFASGIPGWRTDRGMVYIKYGPPDEIEPHPTGGTYQRPIEEGGGEITTYAFEKWRYRYLDSIGSDIVIEFVDASGTGEYRMTIDPSEKDALAHVPGHQEQPGAERPQLRPSKFDLIARGADIQKQPRVRFKDLEEKVTSSIRYNNLPMQVRTDFIPVTPSSIMTSVTIQFQRSGLEFQQKDGVAKAVVNLYARISTMARRRVNIFEDVISVETPAALFDKTVAGSSLYQKNVPLAPGRYRLNIVAKDVIGGSRASYETALDVPHFEEGKLAASSLILADVIEQVAARSAGFGQFVIADRKVRPRLSATFRRNEKLGIYVQLYHFGLDEASNKPNGTIEYEIVDNATNSRVLSETESVTKGSQITVEKWLRLRDLEPGTYTLTIKIVDRIRNQTIAAAAMFTVVPL